MALSIPLVWADGHRLHEPSAEIWVGVRTPATELPARADAIRATLLEAGADEVAATPHDDAALEAVHDPGLLAFLASAWADWEAAGLPDDPGQDQVVPYIFPHPGLMGGLEPLVPAATWARPGAFCFDTMTLIGPGTWEAARAAADAALTAADLVAGGAPLAYACCRPPGHHVTRSAYGGSCYLNNAAIAAQQLRERGAARVAIVDIDAHHGNGAQSIFWERDDVFTGLGAHRSRDGLVPALPRQRRRARRWCRARLEPQRPAATGSAGRRVAAGGGRARAGGAHRAAPRRSCSRSASTRPAATPRARSTLRFEVFARRAPDRPTTGCRSSSYRRAGTISPRSAGSCSRPWKDSRKAMGMPEPLDVWLGKDEVEGVPPNRARI